MIILKAPSAFRIFFITAILALLARPALLEPLPPIALPTAECFGAARGAEFFMGGRVSLRGIKSLSF